MEKFLAFGLALPNHPYSGEFLTSLKAVAPLFPEVTVIVGNGEEFAEFSQQYNVRSYPKLLVFNRGVLHGRYTAEFGRGYVEEDLIRYFSEWTKTKPVCEVLPRELRGWSGKEHELHIHNSVHRHGNLIQVIASSGDLGWSGRIALTKRV